MNISIEEAVSRLKAEILAQDWQLPERRIRPLEEALEVLKSRYSTKKHPLNLLIMLEKILLHAKRQGDAAGADCIDFLKETMAHLIRIHEGNVFPPAKERQIFERLYSEFTTLKEKACYPSYPTQHEADLRAAATAMSDLDTGPGPGGSSVSADNRRKNSRVNFEATADIAFGNASRKGCETRDLSLKGVFVIGVPSQPVGTSCQLHINLSGAAASLAINIAAEVIRSTPEGLGLLFKEMDLESFTHLKNVLYYNLGDPEMIDREIAGQLGTD